MKSQSRLEETLMMFRFEGYEDRRPSPVERGDCDSACGTAWNRVNPW